MTREFDVYLDGDGYMLARRADGQLMGEAAKAQAVDSFTRQIGADEPYARAPFRFGDGAGLLLYDGSNRYEWGNGVDARSGRLVLVPERNNSGGPWHDMIVGVDSTLAAELIDSGGAQVGLAERFQVPAGVTHVRNVAVLLKRDATVDYTAAGPFTVGIYADAAGPKPGALVVSQTSSLASETTYYLPYTDRWRNADWFWLELVFAASTAITAGNWYWLVVANNQVPVLHWAEDRHEAALAMRSVWNGAAWGNGTNDYPLMYKLGFQQAAVAYFPDSFPWCFQVYRGVDTVERLFCGDAYRVKAYCATSGANTWAQSLDAGTPVLELLEFNSYMFAALGHNTDMQYFDGTTAATNWAAVVGEQANALAVHDNLLWKADYHVVEGCLTGLVWGHGTVDVGDPGTPVQAMVSHGGKLYAAKPEGIFEISYPDTYPATGSPTCNLVLDFSTERCPRRWMLDWHSGLYFPGLGGVYELKGGVLRNIWEEKVDEGALDAPVEQGAYAGGKWRKGGPVPYTRPRSWSPLYDSRSVVWTCAHGSTRGMVFGRCNPHTGLSEVLWWDGRNWYSVRAAGVVDDDGDPAEYGEYVTAVFLQDLGGGRGRLWWNSGMRLDWCDWPTWTDDLAEDGTFDFEQYGVVTLPWFTLGWTEEVLLAKVGLVSQDLVALSRTVTVLYRTDYRAAWTTLGTVATSPYVEVDFPASTTCRRVQFRLELELVAGPGATSPVLEGLDLFYQTFPEVSRTHQLVLMVADLVERKNGSPDRDRTAADLAEAIEGLVGAGPFTYEDVWGNEHTVRAMGSTVQPMRLMEKPGGLGYRLEGKGLISLLEV